MYQKPLLLQPVNPMEHLKLTHSIFRYLILLASLYAIFRAYRGMSQSRSFTNDDKRAGFILTMLVDLQLLMGLGLYFMSNLGFKSFNLNGTANVMKDSFLRFFAVEHITAMLIAIVLIHVGNAKSKKGEDATRHKLAFRYYLIALIIMLASIPWPFRHGFEGMKWLG